jgi:DUF1680 family protein
MNAARLIASVGGYFCSESKDAVVLHLYGGISTTVQIGGQSVRIKEESDYPWSGVVKVTIDPDIKAEFSVKLRIPGWAKNATASVNGTPVDLSRARNGYLDVRRSWSKGDVVMLDLPMRAERVYAHPLVRTDVGRVALRRGPLVYCLEEIDNRGHRMTQLRLPRNSKLEPVARDDLFDGVVTIVAEAKALETTDWQSDLYRTVPPQEAGTRITAVPYYLWSNRDKGSMAVWIAED